MTTRRTDGCRQRARARPARRPRDPAARRHAARRPPLLARRRRQPPRRDRQRRLRRGRARRGRRLPGQGVGLRSRAPRLDPDRHRDPLLGGRRGLLGDLHRRQRERPLPLARRRRLPRSSTRSPTPASRCWSGPGRTRSNWRLWMDGAIAALGTAALGAAFVFDFVAEKTEGTPAADRDHARLPAGRHRDAGDGRRRGRADRLATGPDLVAAARRALGAGRRRHRLHPAVDRRSAARRQLDRPDLPDRGGLPRRRRLAAGGGRRDHRAGEATGAAR